MSHTDHHHAPEAEETHHARHHDDHAAHGDDHAGGHGGHGDHAEQFRRLFWRNLILAIPVVVFSQMFSDLLGYGLPSGTAWISPVFGVAIFFYGGRPFLTGAFDEVRTRQPGMMLLIGFAITVAFVASLATSLGIGNLDLDFWWELALLIVIMGAVTLASMATMAFSIWWNPTTGNVTVCPRQVSRGCPPSSTHGTSTARRAPASSARP